LCQIESKAASKDF